MKMLYKRFGLVQCSLLLSLQALEMSQNLKVYQVDTANSE